MSSIEEAFRARLVALDTAAGARVYREIIEQAPPSMPVISFQRTGTPALRRDVETGRPVLQRASIRVEVLGNTVSSASEVADDLREGLDGWRGTVLGVEVLRCAMVFQGDASFSDGDFVLKIVQQDYELTFR